MLHEVIKPGFVETVSRPQAKDNKEISVYWLAYMWLSQKLYSGELTTEELLEKFAVKRIGAQRKFDNLFSKIHSNLTNKSSLPGNSKRAINIEDVVALRQDSYDALQREVAKAV